jgi:prophage antirepressor-like protein
METLRIKKEPKYSQLRGTKTILSEFAKVLKDDDSAREFIRNFENIPMYGTPNVLLFKAQDIAKLFSLTSITTMLKSLVEDAEYFTKCNLVDEYGNDVKGTCTLVFEPTVYTLVARSRRTECAQFRVLFSTVLCKLRIDRRLEMDSLIEEIKDTYSETDICRQFAKAQKRIEAESEKRVIIYQNLTRTLKKDAVDFMDHDKFILQYVYENMMKKLRVYLVSPTVIKKRVKANSKVKELEYDSDEEVQYIESHYNLEDFRYEDAEGYENEFLYYKIDKYRGSRLMPFDAYAHVADVYIADEKHYMEFISLLLEKPEYKTPQKDIFNTTLAEVMVLSRIALARRWLATNLSKASSQA